MKLRFTAFYFVILGDAYFSFHYAVGNFSHSLLCVTSEKFLLVTGEPVDVIEGGREFRLRRMDGICCLMLAIKYQALSSALLNATKLYTNI